MSIVFALDLVLPPPVGNVTASQILQIPQGPYTEPCATLCDAASASITVREAYPYRLINRADVRLQACTDTDDACLCTPALGAQLQACEQCMYEQVLLRNIKVPDIRVGSNAVMSGKISFTLID